MRSSTEQSNATGNQNDSKNVLILDTLIWQWTWLTNQAKVLLQSKCIWHSCYVFVSICICMCCAQTVHTGNHFAVIFDLFTLIWSHLINQQCLLVVWTDSMSAWRQNTSVACKYWHWLKRGSVSFDLWFISADSVEYWTEKKGQQAHFRISHNSNSERKKKQSMRFQRFFMAKQTPYEWQLPNKFN